MTDTNKTAGEIPEPVNDQIVINAIREAYETGYNDGKHRNDWAAYEVAQEQGTALMQTLQRRIRAAAILGAELVGEAGAMPGTSGFTMACFHAANVPVGTKLYTIPEKKENT